MVSFGQGHARDGTVPRFFCPGPAWPAGQSCETVRNLGICCPAGFKYRDCPADFCPGLDYPVALSPGPVPNPGDLRDQHADIVPGQPFIPGFEYNTLNFKMKIFL